MNDYVQKLSDLPNDKRAKLVKQLPSLSYAQQRLWFLAQLEPESHSYNIAVSIRIKGPLNLAALDQALSEIARRHEVLRTVFVGIDGGLFQVITPVQPIRAPLVDLSGLGEDKRKKIAKRLAAEEARIRFDLSRGPLLKVKLLRLLSGDYVILLTIHHIIFDGWSKDILLLELTKLYESYSKGQCSPLPQLLIQYADYAEWQMDWLKGEVLDAQLSYWKRRLQPIPPVLDLPTDYPRCLVRNYEGSKQSFKLSAALSASLRRIGQESDCTLFMTLLAAFQVLLSRYSGQRLISVGTPIAGRSRPECSDLIGFFANTLVLCTDVGGAPIFTEVLRRVREVALGAYANQDLPFEKLVEELCPERDLSSSPLFQVMFTLEMRRGGKSQRTGNLVLRSFGNDLATVNFDLHLSISESSNELEGFLSYAKDIFEAATISRMIRSFQALLEAITTEPEKPVDLLPLMCSAELDEVVRVWNETSMPLEEALSVPDLIHRQAEQSPDRVAIVYQEEQISYRELDERSNQIGSYLREQGVRPGEPVGVAMDRSGRTVIVLLGVMKAGGSYVPIDARYPAERVNYMLEESGAGVVVSEEEVRNVGIKVLRLDQKWEEIGSRDGEMRWSIDERDLAYVIYTSGSTGRPKGVMITHEGITNRLLWMQRAYGLTDADRVLQKTQLTFDVSVWELFWPLTSGARLVVAIPGGHQDSAYLVKSIYEHQITVMHFVPSMLHVFLAEREVQCCLSLRKVICSGEALPYELQECFYETLNAELHNLYGPTEASIDVTSWKCEPLTKRETVPIGKPIMNTLIHILDSNLMSVPVGVPGELCIGGIALARGYLRRSELTAEQFIPNSYGREPGARLYRTGDLARYLSDGIIEFLVRMDHQVKLRGHRIELGEIESALAQHRSVRQAVVILRDNGLLHKRLAAYVVGNQDCKLAAEELFEYLGSRLPDYMVPSTITTLEALPVTSSGKIDRKGLPDPAQEPVTQDRVEQQSPIEELLVSLWEVVLSVTNIGLSSNFFTLGGHSLLATQLLSRVREVFGVELPLRTIFESPTIVGMSEKIKSKLRNGFGGGAPPIRPVGRDSLLPLSFAQQRLWFLSQLNPHSPFYNIPIAVSLKGQVNVEAVDQTILEVMRRHEALRTHFEIVGGEAFQKINEPKPLSGLIIDLSSLCNDESLPESSRLASEEAGAPFNLCEAPLLRVKKIRISERKIVVLMTLHHIVGDGWSMGLLIGELGRIYEAYRDGLPSTLKEPELQYADFAVWQRAWLQGEVLEKQLLYWKRQLAGIPELYLPTDMPRPSVMTDAGSKQTFHIHESLASSIRRLSQEEGCTMFMTLLAAFKALLMRYSGQTDVVVGTDIANRNRGEIEGLIGFFANQLVLRTDLGRNPSFTELMRRVREIALEAYTYQDVPFEKLVEELQPERDLSRSPLFQAKFVLQNARTNQTSAGLGLSLSAIEVEASTAKFDLMITLAEGLRGLRGAAEYRSELFEATTIERMIQHFTVLIENAAANPQQRINGISLLNQAQREQMIKEWNDTLRDFGQGELLHELFEQQVNQTPDRVAVVCGDQQISFAELNRHANQLAHYIRAIGIEPDMLVGICMERSIEMMAAQIGVLKSGAGYVPIDTEYPIERISYLMEDSQMALLLTQERLVERTPSYWGHTICLDTQWEELAGQGWENPLRRTQGENTAYVLYTSGSTGRPKGVTIGHRSITNHMKWMSETFALAEIDVVLQKTPYSFDASVWEFYAPLQSGAKLAMARPRGHQDTDYLIDAIQNYGITTIQLVPTMLRTLLAEPGLGDCRSLKRVFVGGEPLPSDLTKMLRQKLDVEAINLYGPTEAAIDTTYERCAGYGPCKIESLGRPISNVQVYVLDPQLEIVPVGVGGEIHIGGAGLARGYVGRSDLTSERFIPHPYGERAGERLYKTGDVGKYATDGKVDYLFRTNGQIKLRGYRIEQGEIESVLNSHPSVRQAIVTVKEDGFGDQRLVAYVVAREPGRISESELRSYQREKLPEYMIASRIVEIEKMPLTPSGKIDRKSLPQPPDSSGQTDECQEPSTPLEEMVAGIWTEVLKLERVGVNQNFFDLGGHSLPATQVVSRARELFQVEVALKVLFEEPTIRGLTRNIERQQRQEQGLEAPPIAPVSRDGNHPLSYAQQRLWFLAQLEPGNPFYNIAQAVKVEADLNVEVVRQALREVVRRHEVLRARIKQQGDVPAQVIGGVEVEAPVVDLRGLGTAERAAEARRLEREQGQKPFDLSEGPLLRVCVIDVGQAGRVIAASMHHIVSDGWSMGILMREIGEVYEEYKRGSASRLEELRIQYGDFAVWQRRWLQGAVLEKQLDYWKNRLADLPVLELPADKQRPPVQTHRGAGMPFTLSAKLLAPLKEFSSKRGGTMFMTLLAAFKVLFRRYSGQTDVVIGTDIANRNWREIEGLIGFFVNQLVLRTDLGGDPSFVEVMRRVKATALGAYKHQDMPFEKLVEKLQPERDLSRPPLFQVKFVMQNTGNNAQTAHKLLRQGRGIEIPYAKFDITISVSESPAGLRGYIEYSTELYKASTISRLVSHYETLLGSLLADPYAPISALNILSDGERDQLLAEWNIVGTVFPHDSCIHELFYQQVERSRESIAVVMGTQMVTYGDLNRKANQLGQYLQGLGVGPEVKVGICMDRGVEILVAVLGIFKAGGAYVPLDPSYPIERLGYMMEDSGAAIVLTQEKLIERLPSQQSQVISLATEWKKIAKQSDREPVSDVISSNLAYIIYTSGSTGKPKGVSIAHRGLANLSKAQIDWVKLKPGDRILQFASLSFDASAFEILMALLSGGTLYLRSAEEVSGKAFINSLRDEAITHATLPPTLLSSIDADGLSQLNLLISAGEALSAKLVRKWAQAERKLLNAYGPTETTVCATMGECDPSMDKPTIGRPVINTRIYILDERLELVPIGIPGEFFIAGVGLARGYNSRLDQSAESFLPDPFVKGAGERMYRTGDIGKYREDGTIEYIGRKDAQVKLRGFRIELGEIEAALMEHASVRQAVAVVREDRPGDQRLVGYVVAAEGKNISQEELKRRQRERLPEYMIANTIVEIEKMPLTPSGKIDRKSLPEPSYSRPEAEEYQEPNTPLEEIVAGIWAEVLKLERVGVNENFFDLGGHSLLATQVVSRVRELFQVEVALKSLFEDPTVRRLTRSIERQQRQERGLEAPPIAPVGRDGSLPLSYAQQRLWFLAQLEPGNPFYNIAQAVKVEADLSVEVVKQALREVLRRHEVLRVRILGREDGPAQVVGEADVEAPVVDLRGLGAAEASAEARRLEREQGQKPFDLSKEPLLRVCVIDLGETGRVIAVSMHHIVSDGWSMGILLREIGELYEAYRKGSASQLEELRIQYGDFAVWQRQWLQGAVLEKQLDYWRNQLADLPVLELPTDRPRPAVRTYSGGKYSFRISPKVTGSLKNLSGQEGCTLYMTLLAAYTVLLMRYSGQKDIGVGTAIANRNRAETEGLIGFFVNLLVLRIVVSDVLTFRQLMARVRSVALEAYAHQDVPFDKLVEELQPARSVGRSPLFQVAFGLQNATRSTKRSPEFTPRPYNSEIDIARYDLTLWMAEHHGGLIGTWTYSTELFDVESIRRMGRSFELLLESLCANPETQLAALSFVSEAENREEMERENTLTEANYNRFLHVKPKSVSIIAENMIES